jgi:hypothetical protein
MHLKSVQIIVAAAATLSAVLQADADILRVTSKGSIQTAINASHPGDTILVSPGSYDGFTLTKDIEIIGNVPDGEDAAPAVDRTPPGAPASGTVITGAITIQNVRSEDAELRGVTVRTAGEGIHLLNSRCRLEAVAVEAGSGHIGVTIVGGRPVLANCLLSGGGQGVAVTEGAAALLTRCVIRNNANPAPGGGLCVKNAGVRVLSSQIIGNTASLGGGVYVERGDAELISTLLADNRAQAGGAIYVTRGGSLSLINMTVAGNQAQTVSGVYAGALQVRLLNSIVTGNAGEGLRLTPRTRLVASSNTVWQNTGIQGVNTLTADPNLAGYSLTAASKACLGNADRASLSPDAAEEDAAGNPRLSGDGLDRGAFAYLADAGKPSEDADLPQTAPQALSDGGSTGSESFPVRDISEMDPLADVLLPAPRPPIPTTPESLRLLPPALWDVETTLNQNGYTLHNPGDVWEARPDSDSAELEAQREEDYNSIDPQSVNPAFWEWDRQFGSKPHLWAHTRLTIAHEGTRNQARVIGEARLDAGIRNKTRNLFDARLALTANRRGNQTVAGRLDLLGVTVWSPHRTAARIAFTTGKEYRARFWTVEFSIPIISYFVGAEAWVYGAIGMNFTAKCWGGVHPTAQAVFGPFASLAIAGRAWLNLPPLRAELDGKVALVGLVLAGARTIIDGNRMAGARWVDLDARILAGKAEVDVKVDNPFGPDPTIGRWILWNHPNGLFNWHGRLTQQSFIKVVN